MSQISARRTCLLATQREHQRKLQHCKKEAEREDEELRVMEAEHAALLRLVNRSCALIVWPPSRAGYKKRELDLLASRRPWRGTNTGLLLVGLQGSGSLRPDAWTRF